MGTDEILHHYVLEFEHASILTEAHEGAVRRHYVGTTTVQKILRVGLWLPMMHKDSKVFL